MEEEVEGIKGRSRGVDEEVVWLRRRFRSGGGGRDCRNERACV